jgi:hypothetical protein
MFDRFTIHGTPRRSIQLATRRGSQIENEQSLDAGMVTEWRDYLNDFAHLALEVRRGACGPYNCAGHVWASRRTSIYSSKDYELILAEDGYVKLPAGTLPMLGDLAVYWFRELQKIWHVGQVVKLQTLEADFTLQRPRTLIPYVLSKFSDWGGEVIHQAERIPPTSGCTSYTEYWSDRGS